MRIRTIKPEFWSHPVIARMDDTTRLVALGAISLADDEGLFYAEEGLIKSALFPLSEPSVSIHGALIHLSNIGFLELRESPSHGRMARVTNFRKHQRINRASASKLAPYWDSLSPHGALTEDSPPEQGTGNREQGREQGAGNGGVPAPETDSIAPPAPTVEATPPPPEDRTPETSSPGFRAKKIAGWVQRVFAVGDAPLPYPVEEALMPWLDRWSEEIEETLEAWLLVEALEGDSGEAKDDPARFRRRSMTSFVTNLADELGKARAFARDFPDRWAVALEKVPKRRRKKKAGAKVVVPPGWREVMDSLYPDWNRDLLWEQLPKEIRAEVMAELARKKAGGDAA